MPDPCKDEEIQTRMSLCRYVEGITDFSRCSNCPGAARSALQHRRCLREPLQPNGRCLINSNISAAHKLLASSSKQHERWRHEADTVLPEIFARLTLVDSEESAGTFGRSESDPDIPDGRAELSGTLRIPHGGKCKVELSDDREAKFNKKGFDNLSIQDYLKSKPQKPFGELESGNLYMPGCRHVPSDEMIALLMNSSAASPMDTREDRPSRSFVAGCYINPELGKLLPCNDGIKTERCEVLACFDDMQI